MAVSYKVIAKGNPSKPNAPKKFYASTCSSGEISLRDLAKEIAEISTMSLPDVIGVLESVVMLIPKHASQGRIIRLGELGSLRISISSEGSDKAEGVNGSKIKSSRFIFTPGKELQKTLKNLDFVRA